MASLTMDDDGDDLFWYWSNEGETTYQASTWTYMTTM